jgi:hypothetical protein
VATASEASIQDVPENPTARVPDDDAVDRRLSDSGPAMVFVDPLTGDRRPSTGAFRIKPDEDGVSVKCEQLLTAAGLTAADIVVARLNLVVSLAVTDVRAISPLDVRDDRWPPDVPDPTHPRNGAHALIVGWHGLGKNARRERQLKLVNAPSLTFVYP